MGYTSTSETKSVALGFALGGQDNDKVPVLFEIEFRGQYGLFKMTNDYTAYPGEDEILI